MRAAPPKKQRDKTMNTPTLDLAARRTPRTAPITTVPTQGAPEQGGLSAAEIRRIVLDILG
jgi:hypothetical protein